jgi:hypothetical protein
MAEDFPGCALSWRFSDADGERNWPFVRRTVAAGTPVIIMPDRFFWPGDEFEQRFHYHDHAVLACEWSPNEGLLTVLDTDAPAVDGFRRVLPDSPALRAACTRVTTVELTSPVDQRPSDEYGAAQIERQTAVVSSHAVALRSLIEQLTGEGLDRRTARGLHVLVLGHFQPQFFLFAEAIAGAQDPAVQRVQEAAHAAARSTKRLGQALIAAHAAADPVDAYAAAVALAPRLADALDRLAAAMRAAGGPVRDAPDPKAVTSALRARLRAITAKCFAGEEV